MRAALCLLLLSALPAQQIVVPGTETRAAVEARKDGLVLPAGEFGAQELIDATAAYLCRNYLYDPRDLQRVEGFTLQRPIALDALGAEELLYALLAARSFAVLPVDEPRGLYRVVCIDASAPSPELLAGAPWRTPEEIQRRPQLRELVRTVVELQNADAQQLAQLLRFGMSLGPWRPGVLLANAGERRWLLLHGYRDQVATAIAFAVRFDRLGANTPAAAPAADEGLLARLQRLEQEVAALREQLAAARR